MVVPVFPGGNARQLLGALAHSVLSMGPGCPTRFLCKLAAAVAVARSHRDSQAAASGAHVYEHERRFAPGILALAFRKTGRHLGTDRSIAGPGGEVPDHTNSGAL